MLDWRVEYMWLVYTGTSTLGGRRPPASPPLIFRTRRWHFPNCAPRLAVRRRPSLLRSWIAAAAGLKHRYVYRSALRIRSFIEGAHLFIESNPKQRQESSEMERSTPHMHATIGGMWAIMAGWRMVAHALWRIWSTESVDHCIGDATRSQPQSNVYVRTTLL